MKLCSAWPWIVLTASLLGAVETAPCAAQSAPAGAAAPVPATSSAVADRRSAAPASVGAKPSLLSLPPAVSPEIERFVKRSGRDVPKAGSAGAIAPRFRPADRPGMPLVRALPSGDTPLRTNTAPDPIPAFPPTPEAGASGTQESPLSVHLNLKSAPFAPTDRRFPINLATALRLSDARPLIVCAAQARVWVAEAELTQGKALWLPALNVGFDYIRHDGGGPDFNKGVMTAPSVNFFYGGAGLYAVIAAADAYFEPLVARQVLNARNWDVQSAKNNALRESADAYFLVHQYRGTYTATLYTVERAHDVLERITHLSRDLVSEFEVDRARNMLADLEQKAVLARQNWRVQSARLTKVLRLDPRAVVDPLEHDHLQITLIDPTRELDDLMPIALLNRPELASQRALIEAAAVRIRREKARPFIPTVLLNGFQSGGGMLYQAGIFGIGPNSSLNQWVGRDDVSIQLVWQLMEFGFGNLAQIKAQRGQESRAIVDLRRTQDRIADEVNEAHARLQSAAVRVTQAERSVRTGIITVNGSVEGLSHTKRFGNVLELITRPTEAIYALQLLKTAFDEYFATVAEYNCAQFELFRALGYPAREVAEFRLPGEVMPVDTTRPLYLPPVGHGPPPATR